MDRRLDIVTRIVALLTLALVLAIPAVAAACESFSTPSECERTCAELGYMPIECAEEMPAGGCGSMSPAPAADTEPLVSSAAQQAPALAGAGEAQPLFADDTRILTPLRDACAERPPLDPLGTRLLI
ncbi:MAG: hypothetical protein IBX62_05645 [Coriobacteriia bacterium]|nr:hypothetical protein [Coriobacteriia bacterium]